MILEHELAEGVWCTECETFEYDLHILGDKCPSCGCARAKHVKAKVVKDGELWSNVAPELTEDEAKEV